MVRTPRRRLNNRTDTTISSRGVMEQGWRLMSSNSFRGTCWLPVFVGEHLTTDRFWDVADLQGGAKQLVFSLTFFRY